MKKKRKNKVIKALEESPVRFFSDLLLVAMVFVWIVSVIIVMFMALYALIFLQDSSVVGNIVAIVGIPMTAGGLGYLYRSSVAIKEGKITEDFPEDLGGIIDG